MSAPPPAFPADFREHCRQLNLANTRVIVGMFALFAVAWWPVDRFVLAAQPAAQQVFAVWRVWTLAICGGLWILLPRIDAVVRFPEVVSALALGLNLVIMGRAAAQLGDMQTPWFHALYLAMFAPMTVMVSWRPRLLVTTVAAFAIAGGYFATDPDRWHDPFRTVSLNFLGVAGLAGVVSGNAMFRLVRRNFDQAQALDAARRELEGLTARLDQRVREQTAELRTLATHLETAQEAERARLSRELHDELGQELSALRYSLALTRTRYARDPASVDKNLDEIDALLQRTAATARGIVEELRPRLLDDLGLYAALEWLGRRTEARAGTPVEVTCSGDPTRLSPEAAVVAFRIAQESLTNVMKHAGATRVTVTASLDDAGLRLAVTDDGVGVPEPRPRGAGIVGMRERAAALGGTVRVSAAAPRGTRVDVFLPQRGVP